MLRKLRLIQKNGFLIKKLVLEIKLNRTFFKGFQSTMTLVAMY